MSPLPDQLARDQIREDLDCNLVVEAAAGTGKTTALVGRILEVLASGRGQVQGLVAVTFTEKAAGELKLRLRSRLEEVRAQASGSRRSHLEEALAHLEEARINTIHGFCTELLRERPVEAKVDPLFVTMTETGARKLFNQAFDLWLQQQLADPPEGLRRALRRSSRGREDGPVERLRRAAATLRDWRDFEARWARVDFARAQALHQLRGQLARLAGRLKQVDLPAGQDFVQQLWAVTATDQTLAREEAAYASLDEDTLEASLVNLAVDKKFREIRRGTPKLAVGANLTRGDLWEEYKALKAGLETFQRQADADLAAALQNELWEVVERYEALKQRRGQLDFQDLLLSARQLLSQPETRADLRSGITHLFIDEFQDTDPLQAEILMLLAGTGPEGDWREVTVPPGKLFVVADPKQSIYRFRRADVGIYNQIKERLASQGARVLHLSASFRSRPNIQRVVNAAFAQRMDGDPQSLQATYVPLQPVRADVDQPTVVALPIPRPYGPKGRYDTAQIAASEPQVVASFVAWLLHSSGWTVEDEGQQVPIRPGHICLVFRRFVSWNQDVVGGYARALEAHGVPHLLVGGRGYHDRAEVSGLVAALAAVEWPDDPLAVFAALRGPLMALGDTELAAFFERAGGFNPFEVPEELPADLHEVAAALRLLGELHKDRNQRSVAETVYCLLESTRAHVNFVLRPSGEQVLANVLRLQQLAQAYEADGGLSFRGFVEQLLEEAELGQEGEAPILEEGSDGVRLMTAHASKGLEFPVVVLADMTYSSPKFLSRASDPERGLCAFKIGWWAPLELEQLREREQRVDAAEGVRLAYVAATRAQDLLVVTALGDGQLDSSWLGPVWSALYPASSLTPLRQATGLPGDFGADTVLERPPEAWSERPRRPGLYQWQDREVVWWDPQRLDAQLQAPGGLKRYDLVQDVDPAQVELDHQRYDLWRTGRQAALEQARRPSVRVASASRPEDWSLEGLPAVEVVRVSRSTGRGAVYGKLVHALLACIEWTSSLEELEILGELLARPLGARPRDVEAARVAVRAVLEHPLLERVRQAREVRRETPLALLLDDGTLVEGVVDLAFLEEDGWTAVDFKTDLDDTDHEARYRRQVGLYVRALEAATGLEARGILLAV